MARNQIGSVWSASNETSNDTFQSLPARTITAGSLVIVVGRFENSGIATVSVSDTAGATWQVQSQFNSNIQTFIAWSYNHPGYTNDIITATYDVPRAYRNMAAIELDGSDTSDPAQVANIVKSSAVLNHSMTVSTPCDIFAIQGSYSTSEIIATSPAVDLIPSENDLYLFSTIRNASTSPVTIANTGGGGNQASISLAFSYPGGGDVTAPTLTSATATATGANTATGGVTTTEAGPAWAVLTTSSTTPSAAQIKAGQNHTGAAASASATATLAAGVNSSAFAFTGLTGGGTYWLHVVQDDTATPANTSTPITSASSITTPTPDTTPPVLTGSITVGAKTSSTIDISWPAGSDDTAVVAYDVRINGGSWIDNGTGLSYTATGLAALTEYTFDVTARDAAGNRSSAISTTTSTYRAGALASTILLITGPQDGNPAGFLYAFAGTVSAGDWLSYTIVSGPTPAGGSLDANAMGAFSYTGPAPATMVIQPEVNGANAPETITVTLYDNSVSLGAASMASTPTYGSGPVSQAAPVPLTGTAVAVASAYGSGQIAQGAPVVLAGAAFAVIPAMGAGGLVQGVPVALSATPFTVIPVFSAGALSQAAPVALMGAALSVSTAYGPGAISDAPTFTSMAPSPVCATYRRDSYPAHTFQKLAGETLDFDIDFRYELRSTQDAARIHDPVEIQAGQGVDVLGAYWVPGLRRVKMWIAGGEAQGKSDISIWLNTEAGRRLQVDVRVQIK